MTEIVSGKFVVRILPLIAGALWLSSCASLPEFDRMILVDPLEDQSMSEIVSITLADHGAIREELRFLRLDRERSKQFKAGHGIYHVPPGNREIKIEYSVWVNGMLRRLAIGEIQVNLEPGKRYVPYAKRDGEVVKLWMLDALSTERASDFVVLDFESINWSSPQPITIPSSAISSSR